MKITQRIPKVTIIIICLILFWFIYRMVVGIADGKLKAVYIPIGLSLLIMLPYVVRKIGTFPLFCGLISIYWIPLSAGMGHVAPFLELMQPAEFGMWILCLVVLIHGSVASSAQVYSAIYRFPFLPFALLVAGSLTANLVSGNFFAHDELVQIRILCLLPAVVCFLCIYFIKTVKQAELLLWIFLVSAGLLGLVYLFVPSITPPESLYLVVQEYGRLEKKFQLSLFEFLDMNAETTPILFALIVPLSMNLWLNNVSSRERLIAAFVLGISILVIIQSQGRTGLITAVCSIVVILVLSVRLKNNVSGSSKRRLLMPAIVLFALLFFTWYYASISTITTFRERGLDLFVNPVSSASSRIDRWTAAVYVVLENPFGVGMMGFPSATGESWAAHNLYLFVMLSFGIIGLVGFFGFFLRYIRACWSGLHSKNSTRRVLCVGGCGYVAALLIGAQGSCIFWSPWEVLMGWIPIGISMAVATLPENEKL